MAPIDYVRPAPASNRVKQIFSVDPDALGFGVTLSRDDRSIYYGVVSNDADIWLMSVE